MSQPMEISFPAALSALRSLLEEAYARGDARQALALSRRIDREQALLWRMEEEEEQHIG